VDTTASEDQLAEDCEIRSEEPEELIQNVAVFGAGRPYDAQHHRCGQRAVVRVEQVRRYGVYPGTWPAAATS
jgi:hypothetical protein